jgi:hypothetical protein
MIPALVSLALSAADGAAAIVERANYSPENGTTPDSPRESPYGYTPNLASCIAFLTIFSLLTLAHLGLAIRYRYWSAIVTMGFGGILEVIGWAGRLWSHYETLKWSNFIMQIVW